MDAARRNPGLDPRRRPSAPRRLRTRFLGWLVLCAASAATLCCTPLFNTLAYPFALAMALPVALGGAHLGAAVVAGLRESDAGLLLATRARWPLLIALCGRAAAAALALLAAPLALISLNALRARTCAPLTGLAFFALLPALGAILAGCTGALWALALPRRALASAGAVVTVLLFWGWTVHGVYASPAVFAYDPFFGYFPGALYDEDVAVRAPLLIYRAHNLLWLTGALLVAGQLLDAGALRLRLAAARWRPALAAVTAGCLGVALLLWSSGPRLGFRASAGELQRELGALRRTTHFDIYAPTRTPRAELDLLAEDHEYRYAQLAALLGVAPPRLRSYVFASAEQKRRLIGAAHTFIAKPWRGEVYLHRGGFPQPALAHELAHVFAAGFGDRLLGASVGWRRTATLGLPYPSINMGLVEGLAVAASFVPRGEATVHELAATQLRLGTLPPLPALMGFGFLGYPASRAYNAAGSFARFLLERHGATKLRQAYRAGGDFKRIYGEPLGRLEARWRAFLREVPVPRRQLELAREVFRRPSIFHRACPHTIASLRERAEELRARGRGAEAIKALEQVCAYEPEEPGHLLELAFATLRAGQRPRAAQLARRVLASAAATPTAMREAHELLGDVARVDGRVTDAAAQYRRAAERAGWAAERRVLLLKRWALEQPQPAREILRRYLEPADERGRDQARDVHLAHALQRALPRGGLGLYLAAKQLQRSEGACVEIDELLSEALARGLLSPDFELEALEVLGVCRYRAGRLFAAGDAFVRLCARRDAPLALKIRAADWLERVRWRTTGELAAAAPGSPERCAP